MEQQVNGVIYSFSEQFDVNLTLQYENDRWEAWNIVREFVSNALDAVGGDPSKISISSEQGYINIADQGNGFPIVYAKRIGASSSKDNQECIGQFGEGCKMAILTCLRKGIEVRLASQDWLIIPRSVPVEEGLEVMVFDIYRSNTCISGSLVSIEARPEITTLIGLRQDYFLHFSSQTPLITTATGELYAAQHQNKVFNKGVYIKDITALYTYNLLIDQLNRDRDIIDEAILEGKIRGIWKVIEDRDLIKSYWTESSGCGQLGVKSIKIEFSYQLFPSANSLWVSVFTELFGDKGVVYTGDLASREAEKLGYRIIKLDYCGSMLADYLGLNKDVDVCRHDYEFIWVENLSKAEQDRMVLFNQVASLLELDCPSQVKVYQSYAKSDRVVGIYNRENDFIGIKRDRLNDDTLNAVETWIHELNHRQTGADDYDRDFADGLSMLAARLALKLLEEVGLPVTLKLTERGFRLPRHFHYSADNLMSTVITAQETVVIKTAGRTLKANIPGSNLKPYSTQRPVTFYKGNFYINLPAQIRNILPEEVTFQLREEQIL